MAEMRHTNIPERDMSALVPPLFARRVSWGAIFAGAVVASVIQIVLTLLGMGVGLYAIEPPAGEGLAWGTWAWWLVSGVVSLAIGGWVAARLAGIPRRTEGVLHGLATWGVTTLATLFLLGTAVGSFIGGGWSMMQQGAQRPEIAVIIPDAQQQAQPDGQIQQQPQIQQPVVSERQVNTVAAASLWTFFMLVLGAIATAIGGMLGSPHHMPVSGVDANEHLRYEQEKRKTPGD